MALLILIIAITVLIALGYFGYLIRKDQFLQIKEYATFIADSVSGRIIKWSLLSPTGAFSIIGIYQSYRIKIYIYLDQTQISIFSDKLPKQKKFIISYPKIADGIAQTGKSLTMTIHNNKLNDTISKKEHFNENIKRLLSTIKQLESKARYGD